MVKSPLSGISIRSRKSSMRSPTGPTIIKSPLGQIFSTANTHFANKKEEAELMGNKDFRYDVLEPNGIVITDYRISDEDWSRIAFSLGIPLKQEAKITADVTKLAYKLRKRKSISEAQAVEALVPALIALSEPLSLSQEVAREFYTDAVPCAEEFKNSIHRVPKPNPSISIGYKPKAFAHIDQDLQKGIIANEDGYPVDLGRISQPVPGHYWPFLIIEASEHSMIAAKHASAITASSCNNAARLLAHAARDDNHFPVNGSLNSDTNMRHCFSLSVSGKIASLNVHESDSRGRHILRTIFTYSLDDEDEAALLLDRLRSIMIWGRYSRLPEIGDKLEALDRKVNGGLPPNHMATYKDDFDPQILKTLNIRASRSKRKRVVPNAIIPGWIRDGGIMTD